MPRGQRFAEIRVVVVADRQCIPQHFEGLLLVIRRVGGQGGNQAINAKLDAYYNVDKPEGAPDYSIAFQFSFLFPK